MHRLLLPSLALSLTACQGDEALIGLYRPSLTQVRVGEVVVEHPPVVPEDLYIPGIVIKPEDYDLSDRGRSAPRWSRARTDLSAMEELEDPAALTKHQNAGSAYTYVEGTGSLIDEGAEGDVTYDDVEQGSIGDCYLVAALSAVLYTDLDRNVREGMIREIKDEDGRVTRFAVRFYDAWGEPQDIPVDADLVRKDGKVLYARSLDTSSEEEWAVSLVEKAYAEWHGDYEKIGNGGWAGDVMQALTGSTATYREVKYLSDDSLVSSVQDSISQNKAVVASTFGEDDGVDYAGTNIYAFHAYSVLGIKETEGGPLITLRNPWGEVEPAGNGADDGIFDLTLSEFRRLYEGATFGGASEPDVTAPARVDDLAVSEILDGKALLRFTATGDDGTDGLAAAYDLRISTSPLDDASFYSADRITLAAPQAPGVEETAEVEGLELGTTYYLAIKVEDEGGNISAMSEVLTLTLEDDAKVGEQLFDFESAQDEWEATGLFHWTDARSASPSHSFWFGQEESDSYETGARIEGSLSSPVLDLDDLEAPAVLWEQVMDVEEGDATDQARLMVATEAGGYEDWQVVWSKTSTHEDFELAEADLSAFEGQRIVLRFVFDSVDEKNNSASGWFIDDIWVVGS